jgi:hypothetical protein
MVRDFHNLIGRAGRAGMHTEGSVIFSSPEVYDEKTTSNAGRWRWRQAKNLLDPINAEPVRSSILSVFAPYEQTFPPIVLQIDADQLQTLAFADADTIEIVVNQGLAANPQISAREFRTFLNGRARAVQNIAAFLISHVDFDDQSVRDRVADLAANTLAYHVAAPETQAALIDLFQGIAAAILNNADADLRSFIRKSPLSPASTTHLRRWLQENLGSLGVASQRGELLEAIHEQLVTHLTSSSVRALSNPDIVLPALQAWVGGQSFETIYALLAEANVRVSNRGAKIEDVVALCEDGFGYDAAMIVASLADFAENLDSDLRSALALLQQQIKYGLSSSAAIGFFEAGFADRVVATELANLFPSAQNRGWARAITRLELGAIRAALAEYPSYFSSVLDEMAVG